MFRSCFIFTLLALGGLPHARAQQNNAQEVLARLRASVQNMTAALPDVTCHERVTSTRAVRGKVRQTQHFEYMLTVTHPAKEGEDFPENRQLLTYNGKPARKSRKYAPVFSISDGFGATWSGLLSAKIAPCEVASVRNTTVDGEKAVELNLSVNPAGLSLPACKTLNDDPEGKATFWVSAQTGRLIRFHLHAPHKRATWTRLLFGIPHGIGLVSTTQRYMSLDVTTHYTSVQLGPDLTVIPATVDATGIFLKKPDVTFTYRAHNDECHRFVATVKMLPVRPSSPRK